MTTSPGRCPNPECNGDRIGRIFDDKQGRYRWICADCYASSGWNSTPEAALAAWNRRGPQWRTDMENAPENVPVDLWVRGPLAKKHDCHFVPALGLQFRRTNCKKRGGYWVDCDGKYVEGYRGYDDSGDYCLAIDDRSSLAFVATHWMPLQPPPKEPSP